MQASKAILSEAERLSESLDHIKDEDARSRVEASIQRLIDTANTLTQNVATTTSTATETLSGTSSYVGTRWFKPG